METFIIILGGLFILTIINVNLRAKMKKQKKDHGQIRSTTNTVLFIGLLFIIIGVVIINKEKFTNKKEDVIQDEYVIKTKPPLSIEERMEKTYGQLKYIAKDDQASEYYLTTTINELGEILLSSEADQETKNKVSKTLDSLITIKMDIADEHDLNERKSYEQRLRNNFLDLGYDIKVKVSGQDNRTVKLTYVLFNDVWFRKFETGGEFVTLKNFGFNKIIMSDGYDYTRTYQWK